MIAEQAILLRQRRHVAVRQTKHAHRLSRRRLQRAAGENALRQRSLDRHGTRGNVDNSALALVVEAGRLHHFLRVSESQRDDLHDGLDGSVSSNQHGECPRMRILTDRRERLGHSASYDQTQRMGSLWVA